MIQTWPESLIGVLVEVQGEGWTGIISDYRVSDYRANDQDRGITLIVDILPESPGPRQVAKAIPPSKRFPDQLIELVGIAEIADRAGVLPDTVHKWRTRHTDFPEPHTELAAGPVWRWLDIENWLTATNRIASDE